MRRCQLNVPSERTRANARVNLDLDLTNVEDALTAVGRLDVNLAADAGAANEDVGETVVGELGEAALLLEVCIHVNTDQDR